MEPLAGAESVRSFGDVIDRAIAEVAKQEYQRLTKSLSEEEIVGHVRRALEELKKLGEGGMPAYDCEWVALFYLTWYQPRQINLVYSFLDQTRDDLPERLLVLDLGCGALAVQFALAIFAATRVEPGGRVVVWGVDPSRPLVRIGAELWARVHQMIRGGSRKAKPLDRAMTAMSCRIWSSFRGLEKSRRPFLRGASDHDRWLTSIHAVYHLPPRGMCAAANFLSPTGILMTSDESKTDDLDSVVRDMSDDFGSVGVQTGREGVLRYTTEWRTQLVNQLWTSPNDLTERFLKRPVGWNPRWNPVGKDDVRVAGTFQ